MTDAHDAEDHDDDHDTHEEHEDEEHDHDAHHDEDEDHLAGGEAHVHGAAEAALVLDGSVLTLSLDTPLESFGVREAAPETDEQEAELEALSDALVTSDTIFTVNSEAGCALTESDVAFRHHGDHGAAMLSYTFDCAHPVDLETIGFEMFGTFPGFETVETLILNGAAQSPEDVTAQSHTIDWPQGN